MIVKLLRNGPKDPRTTTRHVMQRHTLHLILAPIRELASKSMTKLPNFATPPGWRPCIYGAEARSQLRELERGRDILTATRGDF